MGASWSALLLLGLAFVGIWRDARAWEVLLRLVRVVIDEERVLCREQPRMSRVLKDLGGLFEKQRAVNILRVALAGVCALFLRPDECELLIAVVWS